MRDLFYKMWPLQAFVLLCFKLRMIRAEELEVEDDLKLDANLSATLQRSGLDTLAIYFKKTEVPYAESTPPDMQYLVLTIIIVLAVLSSVFITCCYCMSRSDKKLQKYVLSMARRCGRKIDKRELECPPPSQQTIAESCPVLLADAGIIIP